MAKKDGSFTFTFSKRNNDVRVFIEKKRNDDKRFLITDYMCEAVRFYEKFGQNSSALNDAVVEIMKKEFQKINIVPVNSSLEKIETKESNIMDAKFKGTVEDIDESCTQED